MTAMTGELPWRLDDIDFDGMDVARVQGDESLLILLAASSFVETASSVYSGNLVRHFSGDDEISRWLSLHWEREELQHGRALRTYIGKAWPGFDWERAYRSFFADYTRRCTLEALEPVRGLELVARCVVETGTATLYRSIRDYAGDPVLKTIAANISSDEVHHYRQFFHFFRKYQRTERNGRKKILGALLRRTAELRQSDMDCGLQHAAAECCRRSRRRMTTRGRWKSKTAVLVRANYPFELAAKMALKPLCFPARVEAILRRLVIVGVRSLMLH